MSTGTERFFWKGIDALAFYDQRTFAKYVGAEFRVHVGAERVPVTLTTLMDILPADADRTNGREFFYLLFEADVQQETLAQGIYVVEHRELGVFRLLLSPRRSDLFQVVIDDDPIIVSANTNLYRAIVNRIAYSVMGSQAAQNTEWPVNASRFNPDSSLSFAPSVAGEYINDDAVFEEGYGPQGEE